MKPKFNRAVYYFDKHSFNYRKQSKGFFYVIRHYWWLIIIIACSSVMMGYWMLAWLTVSETSQLQQRNQTAAQLIHTYQKQIDSLENQLVKLNKYDRQLYRLILNSEPDTLFLDTVISPSKGELNPQDLETKLSELEQKLINQEKSHSEMYEFATKRKEELLQIPSVRPIPTEIISGFGTRKHPVTKKDKQNNGIDFQADPNSKVIATADGTVLFAGKGDNGWGNYIIIRHLNGLETVYAHLNKVDVKLNQVVKRGDVIGLSGNTGFCRGPHLHYEIHKNGKPINPIDFFFFDLKPEQLKKFRTKAEEYNECMG